MKNKIASLSLKLNPSIKELRTILTAATPIVREAGHIIMEKYYGNISPLKDKKVLDSGDELKNALKAIVSDADYTVGEIVLNGLIDAGFNHNFGILSEEKNKTLLQLENLFSHKDILLQNQLTWVLDPIDGTGCLINTNPANHKLKKGNPKNKDNFGISLGLAFGKTIIAGLVFFPATNTLITTIKNDETLINCKKIPTITKLAPSLDDPVKLSSSLKTSKIIPSFEKLNSTLNNTVNTDSTVANMLAFIRGKMKIYISESIDFLDFNMWGLLIKNAGLFMGDINGNSIDESDLLQKTNNGYFLKGFFMLSPSQKYHKNLIETLQKKGLILPEIKN